MHYYTQREIEEARKLDLLTYLQNYEPFELVCQSPGIYCTREHDSLKISNGKWMWWSRGFGGYSALDYLIKVKGLSFTDAMDVISGSSKPKAAVKSPLQKNNHRLLLPKQNKNNDIVTSYLLGRGVDKEIIEDCINEGILYESLPYHNAVFLGFDEGNIPRYASYRSCDSERVMGDCAGSTKEYSFRIGVAKSNTLHVFESAIDLMSYLTIVKLGRDDWRQRCCISLAGIYVPRKDGNIKIPKTLEKYLESEKVETIVIHFDMDGPGILAAEALKNVLVKEYEVKNDPPPIGKDYNEYLQIVGNNSKGE